MLQPPNDPPAKVGICVLNYHHPRETLHCIETLLGKEPASTRVLWIENDADRTEASMREALKNASFPWVILPEDAEALPPAGTVGVLLSGENLGYAGGNNLGLRLFHRLGVPFSWVLNNDTELLEGDSERLVEAAEARPEVGAWGTTNCSDLDSRGVRTKVDYFGGIISLESFGITRARTIRELETDSSTYISGCSLFARTSVFAEVGFIPEDYFLYYEDPAFTYELRKRGYIVSGVDSVRVQHTESLSTGRRSPLTEYYARRNRWYFIERYHPDSLAAQKRRFWYLVQKYLFRLKFSRLKAEWIAYRDYRDRKLGRSTRTFE